MGPNKVALEISLPGSHEEPGSAARGDGAETPLPEAGEDMPLQEKLAEEHRRREELERKVQELTEENRRNRQQSERTERFAKIQSALQEIGVKKVELAFRLVKDDIFRGEDGELYGGTGGDRLSCRDYLERFVSENPEFLPPRISGGSGASRGDHGGLSPGGFDLDRIRPGMSKEDLAQAWKEVARLAGNGSNSW